MSHGDTPVWGTLTEAAEHLQISVWTVRRMISRGEVDARKFGQQIRVNMHSLDRSGAALTWPAGD
ncbi:helix-turn-helix domain-containing protein [Microbacterium sp. NPDC057407]|uniref:helix-turn-helix domain-containing protein n=1 Tax=Microbacterium sp. NPDC057407 TaxID=3346120 RepID=UPI00366B3A87